MILSQNWYILSGGVCMQETQDTVKTHDCVVCRNYLKNLPDIMTAHLTPEQVQAIFSELCENCTVR